jgi:phosphorylcholine metabolism protein LicD
MKYPTFYEKTESTKQQYIIDLKKLEKELSEININIFLIYGTLLGAIRNNDFIPHDEDIDIAYISSYKGEKEIIREKDMLIEYLTKRDMLRSFKTIGIKIKFNLTNDMFDLWSGYETQNNKVKISPGLIFERDVFLPLNSMLFKGIEFKIPNKSQEFLNIHYKNWKVPIINKKEGFNKR